MKKILFIFLGLLIANPVSAQVFSQNQEVLSPYGGVIMATSSSGNSKLSASTSPTINWITATSTTHASTFPYASSTAITVSGALYNTLSDGCVQIASNLFTSTGSACGSGGGGSWATSSTDYYLSKFAPFYYVAGLSPAIIATSSSVGFQIGGQTLLATSTGNVGIATTTPQATLSLGESALAAGGIKFGNDVTLWKSNNRTLNIDSSDASGRSILQLMNGGAVHAEFYTDSANMIFGSDVSIPIELRTNSIERMRVDTTGNIGIATTTPWALLSVNPNALTNGAPSFFVGSSTATGPYFEVNNGGGIQIIGPKTISAGTASTHPLSVIPQTRADGQSVIYLGIDPNTGLAGTIGVTGSGLNLGDRDQTVLFQEERAGITMNGSGSGGTTGGSTNVKTVNIVPSSYNAYGSELEALHITSQTITEALPFTTQRFNQITQPILTATTSTNTFIGTTSTFYIGGAPRVTASGAASTSIGLLIDPGTAMAATTNASSTYGLYVYAPSGGLANYAATFMAGNVGIGTASPFSQFSNTNANVSDASPVGATPTTLLWMKPSTDVTGGYAAIFYNQRNAGNNNGVLSKITATDNASRIFTGNANGSDVFVVTGAGNVGVATTSPLTTFAVGGGAYIGGNITATGTLAIPNYTSNGFVKTGSGNGTISIDTNTYLTANQTVTLSGAISGSGATAITTSFVQDPRSWSLFSPTILQPTTTPMGIMVNNSTSTITNLSMFTSTSTNATSTNSFATTASSTNEYTNNLYAYTKTYPAFSYATSTTWTGTTTLYLAPAYAQEIWNGAVCTTDVGTLNVDFYNGSTHIKTPNTVLNASTTANINVFNTNQTVAPLAKEFVDVGTPASSPTWISCRVSKTIYSN